MPVTEVTFVQIQNKIPNLNMASHKNDPQKGADVKEEGDMLFNVIHIMTARFIFISRKNADCRRKSFFK